MNDQLPASLRIPDRDPHLTLHRFQWVGLPILFLIPVLALLGVFDEARSHTRVSAGGLALEVEQPRRLRHGQTGRLHVRVRNASEARVDSVVVSFDTAYLRRFSSVEFVPSPTSSYEVELPALAAGEERELWIELRAGRAGRHRGEVRAHHGGRADTARIDLVTLIYP